MIPRLPHSIVINGILPFLEPVRKHVTCEGKVKHLNPSSYSNINTLWNQSRNQIHLQIQRFLSPDAAAEFKLYLSTTTHRILHLHFTMNNTNNHQSINVCNQEYLSQPPFSSITIIECDIHFMGWTIMDLYALIQFAKPPVQNINIYNKSLLWQDQLSDAMNNMNSYLLNNEIITRPIKFNGIEPKRCSQCTHAYCYPSNTHQPCDSKTCLAPTLCYINCGLTKGYCDQCQIARHESCVHETCKCVHLNLYYFADFYETIARFYGTFPIPSPLDDIPF